MGYPYIPARHDSGPGNLPIRRIVMHATVSPCEPGGARNVANYFQSPSSGGSAHLIADPGEIVRAVPDDTIAWHAPPNTHSLGFELCDWGPNRGAAGRWADADHQAMLRLAAGAVRGWCDTYGVPIRRIGPSELLAGQHGICEHVDVSRAWHRTDHNDIGPEFPWGQFLAMVAGNGTELEVEDMDVDTLVSVLRSEGISGGGDIRRMNPHGQGQIIVRVEDGTGRCYLADGITRRWIESPGDLNRITFLRAAAGLGHDINPVDPETINTYGVLVGPDG